MRLYRRLNIHLLPLMAAATLFTTNTFADQSSVAKAEYSKALTASKQASTAARKNKQPKCKEAIHLLNASGDTSEEAEIPNRPSKSGCPEFSDVAIEGWTLYQSPPAHTHTGYGDFALPHHDEMNVPLVPGKRGAIAVTMRHTSPQPPTLHGWITPEGGEPIKLITDNDQIKPLAKRQDAHVFRTESTVHIATDDGRHLHQGAKLRLEIEPASSIEDAISHNNHASILLSPEAFQGDVLWPILHLVPIILWGGWDGYEGEEHLPNHDISKGPIDAAWINVQDFFPVSENFLQDNVRVTKAFYIQDDCTGHTEETCAEIDSADGGNHPPNASYQEKAKTWHTAIDNLVKHHQDNTLPGYAAAPYHLQRMIVDRICSDMDYEPDDPCAVDLEETDEWGERVIRQHHQAYFFVYSPYALGAELYYDESVETAFYAPSGFVAEYIGTGIRGAQVNIFEPTHTSRNNNMLPHEIGHVMGGWPHIGGNAQCQRPDEPRDDSNLQGGFPYKYDPEGGLGRVQYYHPTTGWFLTRDAQEHGYAGYLDRIERDGYTIRDVYQNGEVIRIGREAADRRTPDLTKKELFRPDPIGYNILGVRGSPRSFPLSYQICDRPPCFLNGKGNDDVMSYCYNKSSSWTPKVQPVNDFFYRKALEKAHLAYKYGGFYFRHLGGDESRKDEIDWWWYQEDDPDAPASPPLINKTGKTDTSNMMSQSISDINSLLVSGEINPATGKLTHLRSFPSTAQGPSIHHHSGWHMTVQDSHGQTLGTAPIFAIRTYDARRPIPRAFSVAIPWQDHFDLNEIQVRAFQPDTLPEMEGDTSHSHHKATTYLQTETHQTVTHRVDVGEVQRWPARYLDENGKVSPKILRKAYDANRRAYARSKGLPAPKNIERIER